MHRLYESRLLIWLVTILVANFVVSTIGYAQDAGAQATTDPCQPPYDAEVDACQLSGTADTYGYLYASGTSNIYRVDAPNEGEHVRIDLTELPADYDLYLLDSSDNIVQQSVHEGLTPASIETDLSGPGTYYIYVVVDPSRLANPDAPYHLHVALSSINAAPPTDVSAPAATAAPTLAPVLVPVAQVAAPPTEQPVGPVALTVTPADVSWSRPLTVTWSNIPSPSKDDWIGLFRVGADDTSAVLRWYVSCEVEPLDAHASGSCSLNVDPASVTINNAMPYKDQAQFEFRIFAGGQNGSHLAVSNPVTISHGGTPTVPVSTTISADVSSISHAGVVNVKWANIPDPTKLNWIGLYRVGADDSSASPALSLFVSCEVSPIGAKSTGSCPFQIDPGSVAISNAMPNQKSAQFEFRLYAYQDGVRLATSAPVTISRPST